MAINERMQRRRRFYLGPRRGWVFPVPRRPAGTDARLIGALGRSSPSAGVTMEQPSSGIEGFTIYFT